MINILGITSGLLPGYSGLASGRGQSPSIHEEINKIINDRVSSVVSVGIDGAIGPSGPSGPPGPIGPPGPAGNPSPVSVTDVATATYTALSTDYFLCVLTNAPVTITLPTGILGTVYIVKDCFGDAANNPITIQGTGGQLVDGSTATINTNFGSLQFIFNGTDWSIV